MLAHAFTLAVTAWRGRRGGIATAMLDEQGGRANMPSEAALERARAVLRDFWEQGRELQSEPREVDDGVSDAQAISVAIAEAIDAAVAEGIEGFLQHYETTFPHGETLARIMAKGAAEVRAAILAEGQSRWEDGPGLFVDLGPKVQTRLDDFLEWIEARGEEKT